MTSKTSSRMISASQLRSRQAHNQSSPEESIDDIWARIWSELKIVYGYLIQHPERPSNSILLNTASFESSANFTSAVKLVSERLENHPEYCYRYRLEDISDPRKSRRIMLKLSWARGAKVNPDYTPSTVEERQRQKQEVIEVYPEELATAQKRDIEAPDPEYPGLWARRVTRSYNNDIDWLDKQIAFETTRSAHQAFYETQDERYFNKRMNTLRI